MTLVDRAFEVAAATFSRAPKDGLAHPFGFVDHDAYRWRMSPDLWRAFCKHFGMPAPDSPPPDTLLLGEPVTVDPGLPPNSLLLEPVA